MSQASSSNKQRFSTLRIFKQSKSPAPPPKDDGLLAATTPNSRAPTPALHQSRSLLSIQTDQHLLSPYSSNSAAASSSSMSVNTAPPKSASSSSSKKSSIFAKFGRKSKTAPQPKDDSTGDDSISLPWNFEHTIHVNETLVGLPPSWSNRLSEAGFSEHEIMAIQEARRAAGSVSLYRLNTGSTPRVDSPAMTYDGDMRSTSPVSMSSRQSRGTRPISPGSSSITHPSPRTTSLRRAKPPPPPLPTQSNAHTITPSMSSGLSSAPSSFSHRGPRRQESIDSYTSSSAHSGSNFNDSSMNVNLDDFSFPVPVADTPNLSTLTQLPPLPPPQPQRRFVVTNATSPPPAYASGGFFPPPSDEKNRNLYTPSPVPTDQAQHASTSMLPPPPIQDGEASPSYEFAMQDQSFSSSVSAALAHGDEVGTPKTTKTAKRRSKRFSAAPPRLSLSLGVAPAGDDADDWTKTLLSSLPSASVSGSFGLGLESTKEVDDDDDDKRKTIISPLGLPKRGEDESEDKRRTIIAPFQVSSSKFASIPSSSSSSAAATKDKDSASKLTSSSSSKPLPSLDQRSTSPSQRPPSLPPKENKDTPARSKTIPSIVLPSPPRATETTMWDDIMDTLDSGVDPKRYTDISYISAAISESHSPTLPVSPPFSPTDSNSTLTPTHAPKLPIIVPSSPSPSEISDMRESHDPGWYSKSSYLSADEFSIRDTNRDSVESRLSTASTSTVTAVHTIVNVERGVRAMASVVPMRQLPAPAASSDEPKPGPTPKPAPIPKSKPTPATVSVSVPKPLGESKSATAPVPAPAASASVSPSAKSRPSTPPATSAPSTATSSPSITPASITPSSSSSKTQFPPASPPSGIPIKVTPARKSEILLPSKIAEKEKEKLPIPPWKAELAERERVKSLLGSTNPTLLSALNNNNGSSSSINKDSSSGAAVATKDKEKKKPSELLLPLPASSWGYSAVASNLIAARTSQKNQATSSHSYHPQMFQGQPSSFTSPTQHHQRQVSNPSPSSALQESQHHQRQWSNPTQRARELQNESKKMESPQSSHFSSEDSEVSSSASTRQSQQTPITENDDDDDGKGDMDDKGGQLLTVPSISGQGSEPGTPGIIHYYTDRSFHDMSRIDDHSGLFEEEFTEDIDEGDIQIIRLPSSPPQPHFTPQPPPSSKSTSTMGKEKSKADGNGKSVLKYQPWLADLLAPIRSYIDETVDCQDYYMDMQEMAEGESGSVYSCRVLDPTGSLKLPPFVRAREAVAFSLSLPNSSDSLQNLNSAATGNVRVAIKSIRLSQSGTPKLLDVQNELELLHEDGWHEHILNLDALYVDLVDDALWIRMELMERSIADVLAMVEHGLMLQERMIARFASDTVFALEFLEGKGIAHRDVRSDNLLINRDGVVKLADFSNGIRTSSKTTALSEAVGVVFWQPPEMRRGRYNAAKVDVWSLGATVWEMAESEPPFASGTPVGDRWPPISQPELFSPAFHDFLRMCSEAEDKRPSASKLVKAALIQNACGRSVIVHLLSQCMNIEAGLQEAQ